ncbi:MAG: dipeptidase [Thermomicrobia bacterium]|nr:dipeptidase [Thermomicrobia bacterium]
MADAALPLVFDGHNDTLLDLPGREPGTERDFFARSERGHIDLPRAKEGGLGGGFFAVFVPGKRPAAATDFTSFASAFNDPANRPATPELDEATRVAIRMTARLFRIEEQSEGQVKVVRTADELAHCLASGAFCAILHFEGAEAIDKDLDALEVYYRAGLRSIGPVWSRPNIFAEGVPFTFGQSPDTGPGLTDAGKALVRACNRRGVMLDLSHLNEKGFWDVAAITDAPLVATHSNAHALSASPRNLTDKQLAAIKESDGMVGVNYNVGFLTADGSNDPAMPLDTMVRHFDYLVEHLGIDRVGFGSDFDGATMPQDVSDVSKLGNLVRALKEHGYDDASLRKLAHENWIRVLRKTWKD